MEKSSLLLLQRAISFEIHPAILATNPLSLEHTKPPEDGVPHATGIPVGTAIADRGQRCGAICRRQCDGVIGTVPCRGPGVITRGRECGPTTAGSRCWAVWAGCPGGCWATVLGAGAAAAIVGLGGCVSGGIA